MIGVGRPVSHLLRGLLIPDKIQKIQDGLKGGLSQLGSQTSGTDNKLRALENSLDEVQDKLWELDKSWENNLVFYGIRKLHSY